jgi:hypothetical protein
MSRKRRLLKNKISKVQKRYHSLLQTKIKLMKTRAPEMMDPTQLMLRRSNQEKPVRGQIKEKEMGLRWALIVVMLKFYQPFQASTTLYPVIPPSLDKPV